MSSSAADLTQSVGGVSAAAEKSRAAAGSVFSTSADVTEKTAELRQRVRTFLDDVAAAWRELLGADFTVHRGQEGKTARIGPFAGLVAGTMVNQSGITNQNGSGNQPKNLDRDSGSAHVWFALGIRATLDP